MFFVSMKFWTASGIPPVTVYCRRSCFIRLWMASGTGASVSRHVFSIVIMASLIPFAQRNSSKSRGNISTTVSYPTGMDLGAFPYPLTPSNDPVPMTSYLPSSLKNFNAVLASGHSCISSRIRTVSPGTNTASFPSNADSIIVIWSIWSEPANAAA